MVPTQSLQNSWNEWNVLSGSYLPKRLKRDPAATVPELKVPKVPPPTRRSR